jgi:hypothetical protein
MKPLHFFGLLALAAATLHSQPSNGVVYWSTVQPICDQTQGQSVATIVNSSGATIGYSCYVAGTFAWFTAGGGWGTSIRVAGPASGAVGVDYTFYDKDGNDQQVDTTFGGGSSTVAGNKVSFDLNANQPTEVTVLGAAGNGPNYSTNAKGSVYAEFYCPDASTCNDVLPQLVYSALPANPWLLSSPIAWDHDLWTQWSAEGIDDSATGDNYRVSLAICNEDTIATSYTVRIYNSTGALAGTGTTPLIPPLKDLGNNYLGEGGTYAAMLSEVIKTPLPAGVFKILIDGGSTHSYSAVEVLQFRGPSATALQVAYDSAPASNVGAISSVRTLGMRSLRMQSTPKPVFRTLTK